jgi:hypothetical protein
MKLGVGINIFDGLELLEPKLHNTREYSDYIVALVQIISYFGEKDNYSYLLAQKFKKQGLIDHIHIFNPVFPSPIIYNDLISSDAHKNETSKRNDGRIICLENNCTHYCSTDTDEFYFLKQVKECKNIIEDFGYDTTSCPVREYRKSPIYKRKNIEDYFVSFISRADLKFVVNASYFCHVDPTRRVMGYKNHHLFSKETIEMHHYTTIRKDKKSLIRKYKNSSARDHFKGRYIAMADKILSFDINKTEDYEICEDYFQLNKYLA